MLRESGRYGLSFTLLIRPFSNSAGGTSPIAPSNRRLLNQSTHPRVAYSTAFRFDDFRLEQANDRLPEHITRSPFGANRRRYV